MQLNKTLYTLDDILNGMKHGDVLVMSLDLQDIKLELENARNFATEIGDPTLLNDIMSINQQIWFIDQNLVTVSDALMCFESRLYEKRLALGSLQTFWLN